MSKFNELRESFINAILEKLEEAFTLDYEKGQFKTDHAQQMPGTYGNTKWVYYDNDIKHFSIPYKILSPASNKLLNTPDARYLLKCTDHNLFFIPDNYLEKNGFFNFDDKGNFIPLNFDQIQNLLATFEFTERGKLKIKDPVWDLHFVNANDKASIRRS